MEKLNINFKLSKLLPKVLFKHVFLIIPFTVTVFFPIYSTNARIYPSFNCVKAATEVEKLICSDEELAKLDVQMNKSYYDFMKTLDEDYYRNKLKRKQIDWLGYRGKLSCFNTDKSKKTNCLKNAYERRIDNFNAWATRKNYDFFIDYPDIYEQDNNVGYRKSMGKFISKLGEEYYIQCRKNIIIPKFPEEKIYFDDFPGPLPYMNSYVEINHSEENFIYFRCEEIQPIKEDQTLTEFTLDMINGTFEKLKIYPKDDDDKENIINFIKEKSIQKNKIKLIKLENNDMALSSQQCMKLWDELKNNNYEVVPYVSANSPLELKEKANVNCTREQFYKIAQNKYGSNLHFVPPFRVYTIGQKTYLVGKTSSKNVCQINTKKCYCKVNKSLASDNEGILIKIQNKFYFVKFSKFMGETISITQLSDETIKQEFLKTSCIVKFLDNNSRNKRIRNFIKYYFD